MAQFSSGQCTPENKMNFVMRKGILLLLASRGLRPDNEHEKPLERLRDVVFIPKVSSRFYNMSHVMRKPVLGVCDQGKLKLACAATEANKRLEISNIETKGNVLFGQWITKTLIRLRKCAGWSVSLLFAYGKNWFSHGLYIVCTQGGLWRDCA